MKLYRPELEKDNPVAPQMYVGPRRRLAQARKASRSRTPGQDTMNQALQTLTETAERFVNSLPSSKTADKKLIALRKAITKAQRLLSSEPATDA